MSVHCTVHKQVHRIIQNQNVNFRSVRRDLLRTKQRIYEDYCSDDGDGDGESRNAAGPTTPNGHVIKGGGGGGGNGGNGYTRLAQSDDSAVSVNLLLHHDGEDED